MSARLAFYMTPVEERRKLVQFIKKNYILVDVDGYVPGGSKAEYAWGSGISGNSETSGCGNNAWDIASAGGARLGAPASRGWPDIRKAWIEYKTLDEESRKPTLPAAVQDNPKKARLEPPSGSL